MIKLNKLPTPQWIINNKASKTAEYLAADDGNKPSPWRAEEIVQSLKTESSRKCIYCEGFVDDVAYSAVEHLKPKKWFPELVLEWSNLGLVCTRCNTNKGDYTTDDSSLALLNPYIDNVEEHLQFRGPLTTAISHSTRGRNTIRKLKFFRRDELLMTRMRRIEELDARLELWHDEPDGELKTLYAEDVQSAIAPTEEFSAVLRTYAVDFGFPVSESPPTVTEPKPDGSEP